MDKNYNFFFRNNKMFLLVFVLYVVVVFVVVLGWKNSYDQLFNFNCYLDLYLISCFMLKYDNSLEDRVFDFECR